MANVLLLSMSLFNRDLSEHYYTAENGNYVFCGVSQLEAGTKFFLRKLQRNNMKLDKIIAIESEEVKKEQKPVSSWLNGSHVNGDVKMTATGFYRERISQYIDGTEKITSEQPGLTDKAEAYEEKAVTQGPLNLLYPDPESLFEIVEMGEGESAVYDCIKVVCERIREFAGEDDEVKLYLDMQGARRYETFVINTVVKMLEIFGIRVQGSVAVDFAAGNTKNGIANAIVDTTDNNIILEMVAGMNEFIRTGRGDTLWEFWQKYKKIQKIQKDSKESAIIKQIKQTADAISLCDTDGFEKNLSDLKNIIEEYETMDDSEKQPLFQTLVTELKEDYFGRRHDLQSDNEGTRIINQIRWCIDKKLYQQALALVEEKIPEDLVNNHILYYGDKEQLVRLINGILGQGWNKLPNYLLVEYKREVKEEKAALVWIKYVIEYRKGHDGRALRTKKQVEQYMDLMTQTELNAVDSLVETEIGDMLNYYYILNEQRNKVMHATGENHDANTVKNQLMQFVKKYEDLLKRQVTYDYSRVRPLTGTQ